MIRAALNANIALSRAFDRRVLPQHFTTDGRRDLRLNVVPRYIQPGMTVWDVGGGSQPQFPLDVKAALLLNVVALDLDANELAKAPPGSYDRTVVADLATYRGRGEADAVICNCCLEHVRDTSAAFRALASLLKPGGTLLVFTPSRNALFARLNMALPQRFKARLLHWAWPHTREGHQGFPAYYDRCTPRDFRRMADAVGLEVVELRPYYLSGYFAVLAPAYLLWRLWVLGFWLLRDEQAAETFTMVARRR
jgi:SAM-dependent methyltransferase